ncbi:MAG: hypothetical protein NZM38_02620 [Cytophagales bacterium]|nr:hypothetical protein [Cytophagales bacterium]MDW8383647.1 hypothetical protein [Flammeovirgaceae bacterium]
MKKLFLGIGCIFLFIASRGQSQENDNQAGRSLSQRAERFAEKMKSELQLSDEQVNKIRQVQLDFWEQKNKILEKYTKEKKEVQSELRLLRQKRRQAFREILTNEQLKKWESLSKARRRSKKANKFSPKTTEEDESDEP